MARALIIAVLLILLAAVVIFAVVGWQTLGDVTMSGVGVAALVAGAVLTILVGGGLMALVFYSSRRGYDERAGQQFPPENGKAPRD